MSQLNRREVIGLGAAAGVGLALTSVAKGDNQNTSQESSGQAVGSGPVAARVPMTECTINLPETHAAMGCSFSRMTPDPRPGRVQLTINGLPPGTRGISAWVTEWNPPNNPNAGSAFFYTSSVQLYDNGTKCRVIFQLDWNAPLPAAAQIMYCVP
jgi:hypothetical protein